MTSASTTPPELVDLFDAFAVFVRSPWLCVIPAAAFALARLAVPSRAATAAALAWAAYGLYEAGVSARILCSGECNIRADMLLIVPILTLISLIAVARIVLRVVRKRA